MAETKAAKNRRRGERRRDIESAKRWVGMQRRLRERRWGSGLRGIHRSEPLARST